MSFVYIDSTCTCCSLAHACDNKLNRSDSPVLFGQALEQHYYSVLEKWLKCYNQPGMSKAKDKQGRTIWYHVSAAEFKGSCVSVSFSLVEWCSF